MLNQEETLLLMQEDGTLCTGGEDCDGTCRKWGTLAQFMKLYNLCQRYKVALRLTDYMKVPLGDGHMLEGWVGGQQVAEHDPYRKTIYLGVEPNGDSHS